MNEYKLIGIVILIYIKEKRRKVFIIDAMEMELIETNNRHMLFAPAELAYCPDLAFQIIIYL